MKQNVLQISWLLLIMASCSNVSKKSNEETKDPVQTIAFEKTNVLNSSQL
jgi:hypothetical protein